MLFKNFFGNPIAVSLLSFVVGIVLLGVTDIDFFTNKNTIVKVIDGVAIALITAGTFGVIFEYFNKLSLIKESVIRAIGPTKALNFGLVDIVKRASDIQYSDDIRTSEKLIISARFSTSFLDRNKDDIIRRIDSKKKITFVRMAEDEADDMPGYSSGRTFAEGFFEKISQDNLLRKTRCTVKKTKRFLSYNFVLFDSGIWVKQYWNSYKSDTPPAYFFASDSDLYDLFVADVNALLQSAEDIPL